MMHGTGQDMARKPDWVAIECAAPGKHCEGERVDPLITLLPGGKQSKINRERRSFPICARSSDG
jgi:hypothetical protein